MLYIPQFFSCNIQLTGILGSFLTFFRKTSPYLCIQAFFHTQLKIQTNCLLNQKKVLQQFLLTYVDTSNKPHIILYLTRQYNFFYFLFLFDFTFHSLLNAIDIYRTLTKCLSLFQFHGIILQYTKERFLPSASQISESLYGEG